VCYSVVVVKAADPRASCFTQVKKLPACQTLGMESKFLIMLQMVPGMPVVTQWQLAYIVKEFHPRRMHRTPALDTRPSVPGGDGR
jgi:hypothetical protein